MDIALWVAQGLLAALFAFHGVALIAPPENVKAMFDALPFPRVFMQTIGVLEVLGALGLVLPWATGIQRQLTALAALGLGIIMVGAVVTHLSHAEFGPGIANAVIIALLAFVATQRRIRT